MKIARVTTSICPSSTPRLNPKRDETALPFGNLIQVIHLQSQNHVSNQRQVILVAVMRARCPNRVQSSSWLEVFAQALAANSFVIPRTACHQTFNHEGLCFCATHLLLSASLHNGSAHKSFLFASSSLSL